MAVASAASLCVLASPAQGHGGHLHRGGDTARVVEHGHRLPSAGAAQERRVQARTAAVARQVIAGSVPALASSWCGTPSSTDRAPAVAGQRAIKVIYARVPEQAGGGQDRLARGIGDALQGAAKATADAVIAATNGARSMRFDTGTACGGRYLDITAVDLPTGRDYKNIRPTEARAQQIREDLAATFRATTGCRALPEFDRDGELTALGDCDANFLVFVDGAYAGDGVRGTAQVPMDTDPDPARNDATVGAWTAMIFGPGGDANGKPNAGELVVKAMQHEVMHTLGAVVGWRQGGRTHGAPHATGYGHCWDGALDVMCYRDGGPMFPSPSTPTLDRCTTGAAVYDCGADDYLAANPPAGSYLASSWNAFNSPFLCGEDCGTSAPPDRPAPPPTQTTTIAPPPTSTTPVAPPRRTPTVTDPVQIALEAAAGAARVKLRRLGGRKALLRGRSLVIPFSPPRAGTLRADLRIGRKAAASARRSMRAKRSSTLTVKLSKSTRRKLRRAKGSVVVRLRFDRASLTRTIGR